MSQPEEMNRPTSSRSASGKPLRFVIVGVANTALDFALLFLLTRLGVPLIAANMISTGVALTFSFFLNRSYTFGSSGGAGTQAVKFVLVTLVGLWILQPIVLVLGMAVLPSLFSQDLALLFAKGAATVVSMVWNYLLYDRFVFRTAE